MLTRKHRIPLTLCAVAVTGAALTPLAIGSSSSRSAPVHRVVGSSGRRVVGSSAEDLVKALGFGVDDSLG